MPNFDLSAWQDEREEILIWPSLLQERADAVPSSHQGNDAHDAHNTSSSAPIDTEEAVPSVAMAHSGADPETHG